MERMIEILIQVVYLSITGSVLTLLIIPTKKHILNQCGARFWDKILFFILLLFILPIRIPQFLFDKTSNILDVISYSSFSLFGISSGDIISDISKEVEVSVSIITIGDVLFLIWLTGAISFFICSLIRYKKSYIAIIQTSTRLHNYESLIGNKNIKLLVNENIVSPMTIKFFNPIIILPNVKLSKKELTMILQHEIAHIRRRDQWKKLLMVLVNAIHWFNPIIYLLLNNMQEAFELACDQAVTNNTTVDERKNYCELILHLLWKENNYTTFYNYMSQSKKNMFRRLALIMEKKKEYNKSKIFVTVVTIGLLCITLTITGFALKLNKHVFGAGTIDYGKKSESSQNDSEILDLNQNGSFDIEQKIDSKEIYLFEDKLKTNSEKITVNSETSEQAITVYLFDLNDTNTPIMHMQLNGKDSDSFTNLTAAMTYRIGVSADISEPTLIQLNISSD